MLDGLYNFANGIAVLVDLPMLHELIPGCRVLSLRKPLKFLCADCAGEAELLCQPALPLAPHCLSPAPIALIGRGKLDGVVVPCLACVERFRDGEHVSKWSPAVWGLRS